MLADAVFLVRPDRQIVYWNRAAEELTGYTRDEAVGQACLAAVRCEVCEHECPVFDRPAGGPCLRDVPLTLRRRDGKPIEVLKRATVLRDADGKPTMGIEVLRDVTAWRARERDAETARGLAERQQLLLRGVLDAATDGIVGVSRDRGVCFVSPSAESSLGVTEESALGNAVGAIGGERLAEIVERVFATGAKIAEERLSVAAPDGSERPVVVSVSPMKLPEGGEGATVLVRDLQEEDRKLRDRMRADGFAYGALVSRSARMREVFDLVDQVAPTSATILIQGDSGTGKELVAREVHKRSRRARGPFHAVNCAAIASEILESEFFGHERGAFTGAVATKRGRFEVAHTGTIFLDEVGELPLELQAKLLRVLEERTFERVGGTTPIHVDVRLIAATNRDLLTMVREGKFREDLYYRLRVVPIRLPLLRERIEDVELLAERLLARIAEREGKPRLALAPDALRVLLDYGWPGNVRELANVMEYASAVCRGPTVHAGDLPRELRGAADAPRGEAAASTGERDDPRARAERERILAALTEARWSHHRAAEALGMHRTTLYRKRLRHGL